MRYPSHLAIAGTIATSVAAAQYLGYFNLSSVIEYFSFALKLLGIGEAIQGFQFSIDTAVLLFVTYLVANIVNDLDNPKSLIGKIFIFISVPAWIISVIIYKILYPRSFNGIHRAVGGGLFGLFKTAEISHRIIFHNEIGYFLLLFLLHYVNSLIGVDTINSIIILFGFSVGYLTHIVCDSISGKVPLPITLRLLILMVGGKKETFGLAFGR